MGLFQEVEGEAAILIEGGVYKQVPVYTRDGYIFARISGGFVRIMADGSTTKPKTRCETLTWEKAIYRDNLGRLCDVTARGAMPLPENQAQLLLGTK